MGLFSPSTSKLLKQLAEYERASNFDELCVVISKLGEKRDPEAIPDLISLLRLNRHVSTVPQLPNWLKLKYPYVSQRAAIALAQIGTQKSIDALIEWTRSSGGGASGLGDVLFKRLGVPVVNPFRSYSSLSEALDATRTAMHLMESVSDDEVRGDSRYRDFSQMKGYWRIFEGTFTESHEHIAAHFNEDHAGAAWSYEVKHYEKGMRGITASSRRYGHNHFIWRTSPDHFVLLLSEDTDA